MLPPSDSTLVTMSRATLRALGAAKDAAGIQAVREAGYAGGEDMAAAFNRYARDAGAGPPGELSLEEFNRRVAEFFEGAGWGRLSMGSLHDVAAAVDIADCWESRARNDAAAPACHLTTGLLSAFFSTFAPYALAAMEVECSAAGAARCRFLLAPPDVLGDVYRAVAAGAGYQTALAQLSETSASA